MAVGEVWRVKRAGSVYQGRLVRIVVADATGRSILVAPVEGGDPLWVTAEDLEPRRMKPEDPPPGSSGFSIFPTNTP